MINKRREGDVDIGAAIEGKEVHEPRQGKPKKRFLVMPVDPRSAVEGFFKLVARSIFGKM